MCVCMAISACCFGLLVGAGAVIGWGWGGVWLAFGCFHAMINSFGYIGFPYLAEALSVFSRALLGIYRKHFAQTTLAI